MMTLLFLYHNETSLNRSETSLKLSETSVNRSETSLNLSETSLNRSETSLHQFERFRLEFKATFFFFLSSSLNFFPSVVTRCLSCTDRLWFWFSVSLLSDSDEGSSPEEVS